MNLELSLKIGAKYVFEQLCEELIIKYSDLSNYTLDELLNDSYLYLSVKYREDYSNSRENFKFGYTPVIYAKEYRYEVSPSRLKEAEKNGALVVQERVLFSPVELKKLVESLGLEINISDLDVSKENVDTRHKYRVPCGYSGSKKRTVWDRSDGEHLSFTGKYNIMFRYLSKENTNNELYEQIGNEIKKLNTEARKRKNDMKYRNGSRLVFEDLCEKLSDKSYLETSIEFTDYTETWYEELDMYGTNMHIDENEFYRYQLDSSRLKNINNKDVILDKKGRIYFSIQELKKIADIAGFELDISDLDVDTKTKDNIGMREDGKYVLLGQKIWKTYSYDIYLVKLVKEKEGKVKIK